MLSLIIHIIIDSMPPLYNLYNSYSCMYWEEPVDQLDRSAGPNTTWARFLGPTNVFREIQEVLVQDRVNLLCQGGTRNFGSRQFEE